MKIQEKEVCNLIFFFSHSITLSTVDRGMPKINSNQYVQINIRTEI